MAKKKPKSSGERGRKAPGVVKAWALIQVHDRDWKEDGTWPYYIHDFESYIGTDRERMSRDGRKVVAVIIAPTATHGVYDKRTHKVVRKGGGR